MKKINLFYIFFLYSALGVSSTIDYDFETKKINIENMIRDQIEIQLLSFLSKEDFSINADVDIKLSEVEKKSEVETNKNERLLTTETNETIELPGFSGIPDEPQEKKHGQLLIKEKTNFYSYVELLKVKITLMVDEMLDDQKKEMAKELVREKVRYSYGIKGQFVFKESSLKDQRNVGSDAVMYLKNNGGLLLLFFMFIFILFLLYLILNKAIMSKEPQPQIVKVSNIAKNLGDKPGKKVIKQENKIKKEEDVSNYLTKEEYITKFMDFIKHKPFISRMSFKNLSNEQKSAIFSSIETPILKNSFLNIMQVDEKNIVKEKDETILFPNLHSILGQIKENISLQEVLLKQRFGYLTYLEPKEILDMLGGNNPKELSIIAQYIPESKYYELSNLLSEDVKVEIIKSLSNKEQVISEGDKEQLDERLKKEFDKIGGKILSNEATNEKTIENFLAYDPKISQVINTLKGDSQFKLDESLDKYSVTFSESVQNDFENISNIILNEENETIATAIFSLDKNTKEKILNKFGKMRKEILTDLLKTFEFTSEEIDTAQAKILRQYRKNMK